jgi:ketosteroid isomerase-like protein
VRARGSDPIMPPVARRPEQACALLADAISDGDLDAALMHYEPGAVISPAPGVVLSGTAEIGRMLASAVAARQHYTVTPRQILDANGLALVTGEWHSHAADGHATGAAGEFCSVVRLGSDGAWRIVTESIGPARPLADPG